MVVVVVDDDVGQWLLLLMMLMLKNSVSFIRLPVFVTEVWCSEWCGYTGTDGLTSMAQHLSLAFLIFFFIHFLTLDFFFLN